MKVVIVCGSLRFYKEMMEVAEKTELEATKNNDEYEISL